MQIYEYTPNWMLKIKKRLRILSTGRDVEHSCEEEWKCVYTLAFDIYTLMVTAKLFIIGPNWKWPKSWHIIQWKIIKQEKRTTDKI